MKVACCHYSFHRSVGEGKMSITEFVRACKELDCDGVDFHQRLSGDPETALPEIEKALKEIDIELSGFSLSNNFTGDDRAEQIEKVKKGIELAAKMGAKHSRIFGGHLASNDPEELKKDMGLVIEAVKEVVPVAEKHGIILCIENHGGVPGRGEEVVEVIEKVGSPNFKATVDLGNFLGAEQQAIDGTKLTAKYAGYVHVKDMKILPLDSEEGHKPARAEWKTKSTVQGEGDVDLTGCLKVLKEAGYDGWLALEFEAPGDEREGVRKSIEVIRSCMKEAGV